VKDVALDWILILSKDTPFASALYNYQTPWIVWRMHVFAKIEKVDKTPALDRIIRELPTAPHPPWAAAARRYSSEAASIFDR
jgi:hypothetical protein